MKRFKKFSSLLILSICLPLFLNCSEDENYSGTVEPSTQDNYTVEEGFVKIQSITNNNSGYANHTQRIKIQAILKTFDFKEITAECEQSESIISEGLALFSGYELKTKTLYCIPNGSTYLGNPMVYSTIEYTQTLGDRLFFSFQSDMDFNADDNLCVFGSDLAIVGGTGAFEGAYGQGSIRGTANISNPGSFINLDLEATLQF